MPILPSKSAFIPPAAGAGVQGASLLGLQIPEWVGVVTIGYLLVMGCLAILKYRRAINDQRGD